MTAFWSRRAIAFGLTMVTFAGASAGTRAAEPPAASFDRIGEEALATKKAPGFSFVVVRDGAVVYARGFGVADLASKAPVAPQTRFAIGSLTKQFTAAAILLLAQRGRLALDDPLSKYAPELPNANAITLRMLLWQTSGLHNYPDPGEHPWPTAGAIPLSSILAILKTDNPDFAPGTQWEYSNANYAALSAVVERASGTGEGPFLAANVFGPLGMHASGYGYAAQAGTAVPYRGTAPFEPQQPISLDLFAGAGAAVSTATDMARWDVALMAGTLLDAASMRDLWTPGTAGGKPVEYAMGFVPATVAGHRELWHNGLAPGAGGYCYNAIFPDDRLAVIVLSNGYDFRGVPERMVERVLALYDPSVAAQAARAAAAPTAAPGEDPAVTARAKDWWHRLATGTVDLAQVDPAFAQRLTPAFLANVRTALAAMGAPTGWVYVGSQSVPGATIYEYWILVDGTPHVWSIVLTPEGKIAGSRLQ